MDLNLFENKEIHHNFIDNFIKELTKAVEGFMNKSQNGKNNELDEYNLYEKKKIFLDNKSRSGNSLAWVMDENSVCISENGDGGPISIDEINLPQSRTVGEVYEKVDGKYVYSSQITKKIEDI